MNLLFRLFWLLLTAARRAPAPQLGPCTSTFRVWPNDLDVLRHMNNGRYFSIMDLARVDLMARSGLWPKLKQAGLYPVVVHESMSFRRSLKLFDRFIVRTTVVGWDDKHILMEQAFWRGDTEVAFALVKARFLKTSGGSIGTAELLGMADVMHPSPIAAEQVAAFGKLFA
jgi:acyl-CoA thioesterase FadM